MVRRNVLQSSKYEHRGDIDYFPFRSPFPVLFRITTNYCTLAIAIAASPEIHIRLHPIQNPRASPRDYHRSSEQRREAQFQLSRDQRKSVFHTLDYAFATFSGGEGNMIF